MIQCTVVRRFPQGTRLWNILALCSSDSSLQAAVRYCAYVCRVSSANILWRPISQASSCFSILRWIAWDAVTCQACFRITTWKTMNLSEFHSMSRTPCSSPTSAITKRRLTFPFGAS